jgi:large subunit ribosomal protein L21
MYAVVRTGSKQYRVEQNDVILVEKLAAEPGSTIELGEVLMIDAGAGPQVGTPLVAGARVAATVLEQTKGEKVLSFKRRRRKHYRRTHGHRQDLTVLRITGIHSAGA